MREKAQEKVFSLLGQWRLLKLERPGVIIGVGGCVASQEGEGITARAPFVDLVFGPQTLHRLPEMIQRVQVTGRPVVDVSFPEIEKFLQDAEIFCYQLDEDEIIPPIRISSIMFSCNT